MEGIDLSKYLKNVPEYITGRNRYNPVDMLKTVLFAFADNGYCSLRKLEDNDQVVFRYLDNPNGSANDIAGITNDRGNVVGLMPHPEHNVEELTGASLDGAGFFSSVLSFLAR